MQIWLIISFLILFVLSRTVWLRIIKDDKFSIELHLPLLAVCLTQKDEDKEKRRKSKEERKKEQTEKISPRAYIRIFGDTINRIKKSTIIVKRVVLPLNLRDFNAFTLLSPFAYQGFIYSIIAYLKTKTDRLILEDNAVISSPDVKKIQFYVTVKLRLYQLIYALLTFKRGVEEEKRARRIKYVGE